MIEERKRKLLNYLFPNENVRSFLCNDLYVELSNIIPYQLCISTKNMSLSSRKENYDNVKKLIEKFFLDNPEYKNQTEEIFIEKNIKSIYDEIIVGYVFYLSNSNYKFNGIDIFWDKRSICYSPISLIDIL